MVAECVSACPLLLTVTEISFFSVSNSKLPPPKIKSASPPTARFFSRRDSHAATSMRRISIAPPGVLHCTSALSPYFFSCHAENARPNSMRICSLFGVRIITSRLALAAIAPLLTAEEFPGRKSNGVASSATNAIVNTTIRFIMDLSRARLEHEDPLKFPWRRLAPPPRHVATIHHHDFQTPA